MVHRRSGRRHVRGKATGHPPLCSTHIMTFFLPAAADIGRLRKEGIHVHSAATCPSLPAPHLDNRKRVIVEAVAAIRGGDNPRLVGHKLLCVQRVDFYATIEAVDKTVTALQARLQEPRASSWDLDALATWLTAWLRPHAVRACSRWGRWRCLRWNNAGRACERPPRTLS